MEKNEVPSPVKFPFRFSAAMRAVLILLLALCVAGTGLTVWQFLGFLKSSVDSVWEWLKYILMFLVCGLLFVLDIAMLAKSQYVVTNRELIQQFGLIRTKYPLAKIRSVRQFMASGRLAVYFDDAKTAYALIVIKESSFSEFVKALRERCEDLDFDFTSEEDQKDKNNQQ